MCYAEAFFFEALRVFIYLFVEYEKWLRVTNGC